MLTQYGRQLSYLQCKVENFTSKSNGPVCDCEKDNGNDLASNENKLPPQKTHVYPSFDEYYVLNENSYDPFTKDQYLKFPDRSILFLPSFSGNIFHPPQL